MLLRDLPRRVLALVLVLAVAFVTVQFTRHAGRPAPAAAQSTREPAAATDGSGDGARRAGDRANGASDGANGASGADDGQQSDAAGRSGADATPVGRDLQDLGPVVTAMAERCRVIGAPAQRRLVQRLAGQCGAAAERVDAAWRGAWPRRTLLVVPADERQMAQVLGRDPQAAQAGLARTAAVAAGPPGGAAEQVVVNPQAWAQLKPVGERVVLTHELVHVAVRATSPGTVPDWLAEGFADLVGYLGTGLPPDVVAGPALTRVRAGDLPTSLPADADFAADGSDPAAAYGLAWAAADTLARMAGRAGLVRVYRAVAAASAQAGSDADRSARTAAALDTALRAENVDGTGDLGNRWRRHLTEIAGGVR